MIPEETAVSLDYYSLVRRTTSTILFLALAAVPALHGQIHGVPPSVTSLGPGRGPTPGVPASVTSLGPNGFEGGNPAIVVPNCCNFFVNGPNRGLFRRHHHHNFVSYYGYPVPVYVPYYGQAVPGGVDDSMEEEDSGGPTLFDRRGPGYVTRRYARDDDAEGARGRGPDDRQSSRLQADSEAVKDSAERESAGAASDQAPTVLVFKDGHKLDVSNYAIQGDVLYDLTPGHPRRIALSDLDLEATQKINEDQGITFQLPAHAGGS